MLEISTVNRFLRLKFIVFEFCKTTRKTPKREEVYFFETLCSSRLADACQDATIVGAFPAKINSTTAPLIDLRACATD